MSTEPEERLRTRPEDRFAGESHVYDLDAALRDLRAEAHPAKNGRRQVTLFHRPPVTHALFSFEPGGFLADHSTGGLVTIHCLEGSLEVQADGETFPLEARGVVVLSPRVVHSVRATGQTGGAMLLTVCLEKGEG